MKMNKIFLCAGAAALLAMAGCYKSLVPKEQDYFSNNLSYSKTDFQAILGRTNVSAFIFNADYSTQPLSFDIENVRHADSTAAPELLQKIPVREWKGYYSGMEKSVAEIDAKRYTDQRPILDIRPHSGEVFFWNTDSTKVKPGIYYFDIRVKNGGGQKIFKNMILDVRLPHPYDPYEYNDITGIRMAANQGGMLHPDNVSGVSDMLNRNLPRDSINIHFIKTGNQGNTVSFMFFDKDSLPIPLSRFNTMQWDSLQYYSNTTGLNVPFAFNRKMNSDSTKVTFDITNPYPVLADVSGGSDKAAIAFTYNRVHFGQRVNANISFSFFIYDPGEWTVVFKFHLNPKFADD